jgi:PAS domain S-box-containing protein
MSESTTHAPFTPQNTTNAQTWLGPWETSADPAYCRDLQGRLLAANLAFSRKFGRDAASINGTPVTDFLLPDDLATFQVAAPHLIGSPHRGVSEQRWRTSQGVRWFAWQETGVQDKAGAVIGIRAVGRDITRQRLAEEQFYRLSRAVEQSPVSIVITDLDGRAQYVNSKFIEMSGHTLEDIIDQNIEILRAGHPDEASYQEFWKTVRAGGEWRGELNTKLKGGNIVSESVKVSCLRSPTDEITNYLCLREDITNRKRLEHELRQAQKMESLGTLAGGIAHDFNNLLAIINGYAEFCLHDKNQSPEVLQKGLREIHRAAQRASGLVRQILTFSRKNEIKFAPVDLNQQARDLVALLAETFPRTVTFSLILEENLPPLMGDQNQLQQIFLNLCVNARDAMPSGGTITLSTAKVAGTELRHLGADANQTFVALRVGDTGTGMTNEVRQRIFEPFFTTKGSNGTGLGLAVVYGIVTGHHGFLDVESAQGVGSTFKIYLPLAENPMMAAAAAVSSDFPAGTERLLIVDDEAPLRALLTAAFTQRGYKTATASTGLEAIELISDNTKPYDLVMLDLNMPGASGLEVMKVIRICRPETKVLVISGHITAEVRAEFQKLGHRDFMQKPYQLDELGREVREVLDRKS